MDVTGPELAEKLEIEDPDAGQLKSVDVVRNDDPLAQVVFKKAHAAAEKEHEMTPLEGLKKYPKAVAWSAVVAMTVVMDGFDGAYLGSLYAEPSFQKQFGRKFGKGYQLKASWQTGISNATSVGIMIGLLLNGYFLERFGTRKTMLAAFVVLTGLIFILVFAETPAVLLVGEFLCGIPWGVFHTVAPAYASEVCPVVLRGYLTSFINAAAIIGQLTAAGVLRGVETMTGRWAYDLPFALDWMWPVPLFIAILFCPESPWWLVRQGRLVDAERSLRRLSSRDDTDQTIAMMVRTTQEEQEVGGSSYWDCLKGTNLRRTEIAFCAWGIQTFSGLPLQSYNTYFFEQAGLATSAAFDLSIGYYAIGLAGTMLSWILITWFGRRSIFLVGLAMMCTTLFTIGFVAIAPASNTGAAWAQSVLLVFWVFLYDISIGPVAWTIASEVSATQVRSKTIAIGRQSFYIWSIIWGVVTPYALNPGAGNLKGKTALIYGGTCLLALIWTYFRLPELKGRTYQELNILFWKKVPARKFKATEVDAYDEDQVVGTIV